MDFSINFKKLEKKNQNSANPYSKTNFLFNFSKACQFQCSVTIYGLFKSFFTPIFKNFLTLNLKALFCDIISHFTQKFKNQKNFCRILSYTSFWSPKTKTKKTYAPKFGAYV